MKIIRTLTVVVLSAGLSGCVLPPPHHGHILYTPIKIKPSHHHKPSQHQQKPSHHQEKPSHQKPQRHMQGN